MTGSRSGPLRKALDVSLAGTPLVAFELHRQEDARVSLLAVFQDASGGGLALVTDDRGLIVDPAAAPAGTARIVVAVEAASGSVARARGLRCTVRDDQGLDLAVLSGPAAGATTSDPVHLLGECYLRRSEWRFREIGYGLADEAAITRGLGSDAAAHHRGRAALAAPQPANPPESPEVSEPTKSLESPESAESPKSGKGRKARPVRGLPPPNLKAARIAGERTTRGPVGLEVAVDLSGSMYRYSELRTEALRALAEFARREMAEGDLLTSVAFADRAAVLIPPTDVRALRKVADRPRGNVGGGTRLAPAIKLLMDLRPRPVRPVRPRARALMVITDMELYENPRRLGSLLGQAAYTTVHLVVPEPEGPVVPGDPFRAAAVHRFADADQLGLIYGTVFAAMTGQRLERR